MLSKKGKNLALFIVLFLVVLGVLARFLPHPPNFAPIAALALFGAVYLPKKWALLMPLSAMLISDIFIGFYSISVMLSVYGSFALLGLLSIWLKKHKKWYTIGGSAVLGAILFFVITNFAVWAFTPWYAKTLFGLRHCYLMALPFFRNTLLGNLFYVSCLFGVFELTALGIRRRFALSRVAVEPAS